MSPVTIRAAGETDIEDWTRLRARLWRDDDATSHQAQIRAMLDAPERGVCMLAFEAENSVGFAEASLRHDYVNGCDTSPVLFLEGIYTHPRWRRQGVARRLCAALAVWGRDRGLCEFASDAPLGNRASRAMHRALGFGETERVAFFRRSL